MRAWDAGRWLLLATLWSLQYIFMRLSVPTFGTGIVADGRAIFSALFLVPWMLFVTREAIGLRLHWRDHLAVALVNNVLPFLCFAYAASGMPASYLAVMNGMVPLWSAVIAAPVLKERLGARRIARLRARHRRRGADRQPRAGRAQRAHRRSRRSPAWLGAAFWGWAGVVIRQRTGRVPAMSLATGSILFCALILAPAWAQVPPPSTWTPTAVGALIALGAALQRARLPALLHPGARHRPDAHPHRRPRRAGAGNLLGLAAAGRDGYGADAGWGRAGAGCARPRDAALSALSGYRSSRVPDDR